MKKEDLFQVIAEGREFYSTYRSKGFQDILLPRLKAMLEDADRKCHDFRLREDRGKFAIVRYNTIDEVMKLFKEIISDMEDAIEYCEKNNITIS